MLNVFLTLMSEGFKKKNFLQTQNLFQKNTIFKGKKKKIFLKKSENVQLPGGSKKNDKIMKN